MILHDSGNILNRKAVLNPLLRLTHTLSGAAEAGLCPSPKGRNLRKGEEEEDKGKVRGRGRRRRVTEMTADRERTVRGSGGRGFEAGQTASETEDGKRDIRTFIKSQTRENPSFNTLLSLVS